VGRQPDWEGDKGGGTRDSGALKNSANDRTNDQKEKDREKESAKTRRIEEKVIVVFLKQLRGGGGNEKSNIVPKLA